MLQAEHAIQSEMSSNGDTDKEMSTRLTLLRAMAKDNVDVGFVVDCVVFHDGDRWQAAIDSSGTGDMSCIDPMTDFRHAQQYRTFSEMDACNYSVNIYDEGKTLSIVVDSGSHGTHVAGIIAAYHPDQTECNGVAPGAQLVSLKVGDTRLGTMETGVGITRALIEAVRCGCNIINMSFGGKCLMTNNKSCLI